MFRVFRQRKMLKIQRCFDWLIDWLIDWLNTFIAHISILSNAQDGAWPMFWPVLRRCHILRWDWSVLPLAYHSHFPFWELWCMPVLGKWKLATDHTETHHPQHTDSNQRNKISRTTWAPKLLLCQGKESWTRRSSTWGYLPWASLTALLWPLPKPDSGYDFILWCQSGSRCQ
jgi:hypothetical protein